MSFDVPRPGFDPPRDPAADRNVGLAGAAALRDRFWGRGTPAWEPRLRRRAVAAQVAIVLVLVAQAVRTAALYAWVHGGVQERTLETFGRPAWPGHYFLYNFVPMVAQSLVLLVAAVFFCAWLRRAYDNLGTLSAETRRFSAKQAVRSYFIPLLNLVRPYESMRELWRESARGAEPAGASGIAATAPPRLIEWWWVLWITGAFYASPGLPQGSLLPFNSYNFLIMHGAFAMSGVLAILLIHRITSMQERAAVVRRDPAPGGLESAGAATSPSAATT